MSTAVAPESSAAQGADVLPRARWWDGLAFQAFVIVAVRVGVGVGVAAVALALLETQFVSTADFEPTPNPGGGAIGTSFMQWDALHYIYVAVMGYPDNNPNYAPWFPLYPFLGRIFRDVLGLTPVWGMLAVSWVSLFFAVWGVMALARQLWPDAPVRRIGLLLAWVPVSVFLLSGYPQALFIAQVAWAFYFAARKQFLLAALVAALASATRTEGIVLAGAIAFAALWDRQWLKSVWVFVVGQAGAIAFGIFSIGQFGSFFAYFDAQASWGRERSFPFYPVWWSIDAGWNTITNGAGPVLTDREFIMYAINDAFVFAAVGLTIWLGVTAWKDRRLVPMVVYCVVSIVSIVSSGTAEGKTPESMARFIMCLVPLYLIAVRTKANAFWTHAIVVSAVIAVILQANFNLGGWVT